MLNGKKLIKDENGSLYMFVFLFLLLLICLIVVCSEVIRVHDLKENIYDEIYRASNLSIKTAMYDSYRIDSTSKFNENIAEEYFYKYLQDDLKLNSNFEKLDESGKVVYTLKINSLYINGDSVRMTVDATAYADPIYNLWDSKWEIPIKLMSRNMRTD